MFVSRSSSLTRSQLSKSIADSRIHTTAPTKYAAAAALKFPPNIDPHEMTKFSPQRAREINSSSLLVHSATFSRPGKMDRIDVTLDNTMKADLRLQSYDCMNTVGLSSSMQSNVPQPFGGLHNYAIANAMPGGGWSSLDKYQAGQVQESHYTALKKEFRRNWYKY